MWAFDSTVRTQYAATSSGVLKEGRDIVPRAKTRRSQLSERSTSPPLATRSSIG